MPISVTPWRCVWAQLNAKTTRLNDSLRYNILYYVYSGKFEAHPVVMNLELFKSTRI